MKLSIIAILISISAICYGQTDSLGLVHSGGIIFSEGSPPREFDGETIDLLVPEYSLWPMVDGDTIKQVEGIDFITIYDPKEVFKEMLTRYIEQLPSHGEHETNLFQGIYLEDCEIQQVESGNGFDMFFYEKCNNSNHVIQVKETPTFQGFINYVLNQKP